MRGHSSHSAGRDDLAGEHRLGDTGQAVLALVFALFWALDSFWLGWTTPLNTAIPLWLRVPIGSVLLVLAGFLAWSSQRSVFGEVRDPPRVVRSGLYGHIRHPMYLGEVLLYLGLLAMSISLASLAIGVVATVFLRFLCRHEEGLLVERFGDEYREYMREVGMWFPRLRKPRSPGTPTEDSPER